MNEIILQQIKANLCVKTRQDRGIRDGPAMGSGNPCNRKHNPQANKQKRKRNETKRNETKPTNKQTMKRKTAAAKSEKRRVFLQRNLSKALCNKVKSPAALFSAFTPQNGANWVRSALVHIQIYIYTFYFPASLDESNVNREYISFSRVMLFRPTTPTFQFPHCSCHSVCLRI